jgi:hypothetical protein
MDDDKVDQVQAEDVLKLDGGGILILSFVNMYYDDLGDWHIAYVCLYHKDDNIN